MSYKYKFGNSNDNWLIGSNPYTYSVSLGDYLDGHDYINGYGGNDNIYGYGGNDELIGGTGNDYISGGDGNDYIVGANPYSWMAG